MTCRNSSMNCKLIFILSISAQICLDTPECIVWSLDNRENEHRCIPKAKNAGAYYEENHISGTRECIGELSLIFLVIQSLIKSLMQVFSNILFVLHCDVKQNIWEALYEPLYEALND